MFTALVVTIIAGVASNLITHAILSSSFRNSRVIKRFVRRFFKR